MKLIKVAYNTSYGGFSLSRDAVLMARKLSGNPRWGGAYVKGDLFGGELIVCKTDYGHIYKILRHDRVLVRVIEELGMAANGPQARLAIRELPSGTAYFIDEYNGREQIVTAEEFKWFIAD